MKSRTTSIRSESRKPGPFSSPPERKPLEDEGEKASLKRLAALWPTVVGVSVGAEWILSGLLVFGPARFDPELFEQLSGRGRRLFLPEHDVPVYAVGCCLTAALIAVLAWDWRNRCARSPARERARLAASSTLDLVLCAAAWAVYLLCVAVVRLGFPSQVSLPVWARILLFLPSLCTLALVVARRRPSPGDPMRLRGLARVLALPPWPGVVPARFQPVLDVIVPAAVCALVYIPSWRVAVGGFWALERLHHWDFFLMGPLNAFAHGRALGTEAYSQYGVLWPVVLRTLSSAGEPHYGRILQSALIYACVYFAGAYLLLRSLVSRPLWAAAGILVALDLQMFSGVGKGEILWTTPSSTILRSMMDVWLFLALVMHLRTRRPAWALAAGALVGLAVLAETDTGAYLGATLCAYWLFTLGLYRHRAPLRLPIALMASSLAVAAAVVLTGLAFASRGTLLSAGFWRGWTESLRSYGSGMSLLLLAGMSAGTIFRFATMALVYLAAMGPAIAGIVAGGSDGDDVLIGCLAAYGLMTLILFVGRSHVFNLFHVSLPFVLICFALIARVHHALVPRAEARRAAPPRTARRRILEAAPAIALAAAACALVANPNARDYPGALHAAIAGLPQDGLCLLDDPTDICGLRPEVAPVVEAYRRLIARLSLIGPTGQSIAVLDDTDPIFYADADLPPWGRYSPLFPSIIRKSEIEALQRRLAEDPPRWVVMRTEPFIAEPDVWETTHRTVASLYTLDERIAIFEIWRRADKGDRPPGTQ